MVLLLGCGYISKAERDARWDIDGDGVERPDDCDDDDATVSPQQLERCEPTGLDEDCDGFADELDPDCTTTPPTTLSPTDPECGEPPVARLSLGEGVAEQGGLPLAADGSASTGEQLTFRYDWGDGSVSAGAPAASEHVYEEAGWLPVILEVQDPCGRTDRASRWAAVAEPGQLLRVTTAADEFGSEMSLRQALELAAAQPSAQLVTFDSDLGPIPAGEGLPALASADLLVGWGVTLQGQPGAWLEVQGLVAGLELVGFSDERYGALRLSGDASVAYGLWVRDSAVGVVMEGEGSELLDSRIQGSTGAQVLVQAPARLQGLIVEGGEGVGLSLEGQAAGTEISLCQVHHHVASGIELANNTHDVSIVDSTVAENGGDGITAGRRSQSLQLVNVILANNGGYGLGGELESFRMGSPSYDLWFGNGLEPCNVCSTLGMGSLEEDPRLTELSTGDLAPSADSAALDAGTPDSEVDKNGASDGHFYGDAPEIGAVEVR